MDVVLAGAGQTIALPLMFLVAGLVRLRLGAPVFFRQERSGTHGVPIWVAKFRTMTDGRGLDGALLPDDERLTPLGRFLRASSLDELPQLWSVLRGDLSLVGPRPLPVRYLERYSPEQRRRLEVKPGITGWAQVNGRNALSWPEKLALDVWYVDNQSIWLDIKILAMTVRSLVKRSGISADGHATMPEFMGES